MGILAVDVWWFVCIDNTSELCKVQNVYTVIDMPFRMTLYLIWVGGTNFAYCITNGLSPLINELLVDRLMLAVAKLCYTGFCQITLIFWLISGSVIKSHSARI